MLNPFPTLLSFSFFAPLFLRVAIGMIVMLSGIRTISGKNNDAVIMLDLLGFPVKKISVYLLGLAQIGVGGMLVVGFMTQIAALVFAFGAFVGAILAYQYPKQLNISAQFCILAMTVSLSLTLLGAGAFAFDLPL